MPMKVISLTTVLCLILFVFPLYAQLSYQFNSELGYYNSTSSILQSESGLLTRLEGKLSYLYETDNSSVSFNLKTRPEFFGIKKQFTSLKFKADGEYSRHEETFDWNINLARQLNGITNEDVHIKYDIFTLQGNITLYLLPGFPITSTVGYSYQDVNAGIEQNLDLFYFEAKVNQIFSPYFRTGYGLYLEKFFIENRMDNNVQIGARINSGCRIGPEVELNYIKNLLINLQYRFLFHVSDATTFPSYEQCIKLVAGKIIVPDVSAFILINFYFRQYRYPSSPVDQLPILYTPINQENYINIKTTYDLSESLNIYLKGGYFRENIVFNGSSIEGWNFVFGIELSN
jgi:hypothetical protein